MSHRRCLALAAGLSMAVAIAACTGSAPQSWTFNSSPASPVNGAAAADGNTAAAAAGKVLSIEAFDLGFRPAQLTVPAPGTYGVSFRNTGSTLHDLTFSDGTRVTADAGATVRAVVSIPAAGLTFLCSIPGHAAAGMSGAVTVGTSAGQTAGGSSMPGMSMAPATGGSVPATNAPAPVADPNAPAPVRFDPTAPAVMTGTVHDVEMPIIEKDIVVAKGFVVHAWTFGGTVPGPTIRVHLGDTVRVHLTNTGQMSHSIDFHASQTAMNDQMVEIKPGEMFTYTFKADYAGVWMYHCGTAPALHHIANGMFGMVIVEPKGGLPKVDAEYALVQSEWYLGMQGQPADYLKASAANPAPDFVAFNGVASQYKDAPIKVPTGKRIRLFVLDAGPNVDSSFHVVGTIFDTVIKEGIALTRGNAGGWGSQAVDLAPAQGAIVEFQTAEDGMYPFVTHAFNLVNLGAIGIFESGDGDPKS